MNRSPRRFYFEQLILNRGFENVSQFSMAYSKWAQENGQARIDPSTIRAFITGRELSGYKTQLLAEFLNDPMHHDLIVALWRPPETRGVGGYWEEAYVYNRPPRLIRDINIYDANLYASSKVNYIEYLK